MTEGGEEPTGGQKLLEVFLLLICFRVNGGGETSVLLVPVTVGLGGDGGTTADFLLFVEVALEGRFHLGDLILGHGIIRVLGFGVIVLGSASVGDVGGLGEDEETLSEVLVLFLQVLNIISAGAQLSSKPLVAEIADVVRLRGDELGDQILQQGGDLVCDVVLFLLGDLQCLDGAGHFS